MLPTTRPLSRNCSASTIWSSPRPVLFGRPHPRFRKREKGRALLGVCEVARNELAAQRLTIDGHRCLLRIDEQTVHLVPLGRSFFGGHVHRIGLTEFLPSGDH